MNMAGADLETNLRFAPVTLEKIPESVRLFGMKLTDMTPELKTVYDQYQDTGVLILDPGENYQRLGIGELKEGYSFWMIGNKSVKNLREMVAELLRISAIDPPLVPGWVTEGHRGFIRVVYIYPGRRGTNTQYIKLTDDDLAGLKKLASELKETARKK